MMNRDFMAQISTYAMQMAKTNLMAIGYVVLAPLLVTDDAVIPVELEGEINKKRLGDMLRMLAPHCLGAVEDWRYDEHRVIHPRQGR